MTDGRNGMALEVWESRSLAGRRDTLTQAGLCYDDNEEKGSQEARGGGVAQWEKPLPCMCEALA